MITSGDVADARVQRKEPAFGGGQEHVVRVVAPLRSEAVTDRAQGTIRGNPRPRGWCRWAGCTGWPSWWCPWDQCQPTGRPRRPRP
eukprot:1995246-Alexandrium_andersonii.AAC.1